MKYLIYLLAIIIVFSIYVGLFGQVKLFGAAPNLMLLMLLMFSADKGDSNDFLLIAFIGGLFLDTYSGLLMGSFTVAFLVIAILTRLITEKIIVYELSSKYMLILTVLSTFGVYFLVWAYGAITQTLGWFSYGISANQLTHIFLPELAYNILLFYPMYVFIHWLKQWITNMDTRRRRVV